ncbi:MAG: alpha/beta hydrolase-fold protein [Duncaniella sp.]|nr:alpha/beta hydrolase-fold protein [Duncaniella sp.]
MKTETFNIGYLQIRTAIDPGYDRIAYIVYPMDVLQDWIVPTARKYNVSIVVITNIDWNNDLTPWPAPGEAKGCPDFNGRAPEFLKTLTESVIPEIDRRYSLPENIERTLVGVSLSGLFTLWQWALNDTFKNIATLSGSYWYDDFELWIFRQSFAGKKGKCYMLLGNDEPNSNTQAYRKVGVCTENIVGYLRRQGVDITYDIVPGNHFQYGIERLNKAFRNLFKSR